MKHIIIFLLCQLLIFLTSFSQVFADDPELSPESQKQDFAWGQREGRAAADTSKIGSTWFANGFAGGLLLGPVGTTIAAAASKGNPEVPEVYQSRLAAHAQPYRDGFVDGYQRTVNRKALTNSIVGGAIGTAVLALVVVVIASSTSVHIIDDPVF